VSKLWRNRYYGIKWYDCYSWGVGKGVRTAYIDLGHLSAWVALDALPWFMALAGFVVGVIVGVML
jgi:hypothetical protein